jgi:hypothetical protein
MRVIKQKNNKNDYKRLIMFAEKIILLIIGTTTFYLGLLGIITKTIPALESIVSLIFGLFVFLYLIKIRRI